MQSNLFLIHFVKLLYNIFKTLTLFIQEDPNNPLKSAQWALLGNQIIKDPFTFTR